MKLGAQLYSLRTLVQTPEELRKTILACKEMGYCDVQFSGVPYMEPEIWAEISRETEMAIVCTHNPFDRIVNDTDKLIEEHKIFGCPVIGLGSMPGEFRGSLAGLERFFAVLEEPVKKIEAAGLHFGYHNHAFEFEALPDSDSCVYDLMIERCPTWHFILDTGWIQVAGRSAVEYIERIGGERLQNVHFKEFKSTDPKSICHCGEGFSDFAAIIAACKKVGVKHALVEQDNAPEKESPLGEMEMSASYLLPLMK